MFSKLAIALVTVASIAAVTPASAHGFGHRGGGFHGFHGGGFHGHRHFGGRFFRGGGYGIVVSDSCYRIVYTDFGPRRVNVCD